MLETLAMLSDAQPQLQPHLPLAILVDPLSAWHRREPHWGHSLFQQGCRPASDFRDQPVLQLPHRHRFQQRSVCDQCRCPDDGLCQQWLDFFGRLWCGVLVPIPDRHRLLHLRFSRHQSQLATPAWAGLMAAERPNPGTSDEDSGTNSLDNAKPNRYFGTLVRLYSPAFFRWVRQPARPGQ